MVSDIPYQPTLAEAPTRCQRVRQNLSHLDPNSHGLAVFAPGTRPVFTLSYWSVSEAVDDQP